MSDANQYDPRGPSRYLYALGAHYVTHVRAMTAEGLHSKSDIAAELAWRDQRIESLQAEVERLTQERDANKRDARRWRAVEHVFHLGRRAHTVGGGPAVMLTTHWAAWVDGEHATVTDAVDAYAALAAQQADEQQP